VLFSEGFGMKLDAREGGWRRCGRGRQRWQAVDSFLDRLLLPRMWTLRILVEVGRVLIDKVPE